jgi:lysophospholipase L1-like esterase
VSPVRRRRWPRRLLGLLLVPVVLELALQLAAPLVQSAMLRRAATPSPDAPLRILCVGDSNTYGLHVPQWSWPDQLLARLQPRFRGPVAVVNRGVPAHSAAQVAAALPQDLRDVRPDVVIVLAGLNDAWNTGDDGGPGWLSRLRLVRLARVLLSGVTSTGAATSTGSFEVRSDAAGQLVVDRGDGERRVNVAQIGTPPPADAELSERVTHGLRQCLEACRDFGAQPLLMTYAENGGTHAVVSAAARKLAASEGVTLIDQEPVFAAAFAREGHEALMFNDHHPNVRGYALMAATVDAALQAAGLVPPESTGGARAAIDGPPPSAPALEALGEGRLRLLGPAGWSWQLAVAHTPRQGESFSAGRLSVPLPNDEVLAKARLEPAFSGRFGAEGRIELTVPRWLRDQAGGEPLSACLVLLREPGAAADDPVAAVSSAVEVRD